MDNKNSRVPNTITVSFLSWGIIIMFAAGLNGKYNYILQHITTATIVFLCTGIIFWFKSMGGADVKLLTATALSLGSSFWNYSYILAIITGVLILFNRQKVKKGIAFAPLMFIAFIIHVLIKYELWKIF
jgi:Flp pilus assembly protein protease CpaA